MKPFLSETHDAEALQELGRASVQIVHDLKNQINGLKLYATFLRKRLEKTDGRTDELDTVAKLLAGLERAAADMTTLVRYGRPLALRRVPHVDLGRLLVAATPRGICAAAKISMSLAAMTDDCSAGFMIAVLPVTSAAEVMPVKIARGKFHGAMTTTTPRGK